jgi:uncharacterized delta-60 repeat protein
MPTNAALQGRTVPGSMTLLVADDEGVSRMTSRSISQPNDFYSRQLRLRRADPSRIDTLESRRLFAATPGALDPSFAGDGIAEIAFPLVTQPDNEDFIDRGVRLSAVDSRAGKTIIAGVHHTGSREAGSTFDNLELALARLTNSGQLDPTFSGDGTLYYQPIREVYDLFVQADEKILVVGLPQTSGDVVTASLVRFTADGQLDTTFGGGDGVADLPFYGRSIRLAADGKIVVAGVVFDDFTLMAARLLPNGTLDTSFGDAGVADLGLAANSSAVYVAAQSDGGMLISAGVTTVSDPFNSDYALIRLNTDGEVDTDFGNTGVGRLLIDRTANDGSGPIDVAADGTILVGLSRDNPSTELAARVSATGQLLDVFDTVPNLSAVNGIRGAFDGSGKVYVFGSVDTSNGGFVYRDAVYRFNADGTLDTTWGVNGVAVDASATQGDLPGAIGDLQANGMVVTAHGVLDAGAAQYTVTVDRRFVAASDDPIPPSPPTVPPPPVSPPPPPAPPPPPPPPGTNPGVGNGGNDTPGTLGLSVQSQLPVTAIATQRTRGRVLVSVTNPTTERIRGRVPVDLYLSSDATLDGNDAAVLTTNPRLSLKPGQTKRIKINVRTIPSAAEGPYRVLARVTAPDLSTTVAAAPETVAIAAPVVDLTTQIDRGIPVNVAPDAKVRVSVTVTNGGNVPAVGTTGLAVYASTDAAVSGDDRVLLTRDVRVKLSPGRAKRYTLSFRLPGDLAAGTYFLGASIDTANSVAESNETNNSSVFGSTFIVVPPALPT